MMTDREKKLEAALIVFMQRGQKLCDHVTELEYAETAYKADHDVPVGSEVWLRNIGAIKEARTLIGASARIQQRLIRETKAVLYENETAVAA